MTLQATPYLSFNGRAEEAMTFYQSALGGRLDIVRFTDIPMEGMDVGNPEGVMHAALVIDDETLVMASDGGDSATAGGVAVCLWGDDDAQLETAFHALSADGSVSVPFGPSPWGSHFGQFTDRFGVPWMIEGGEIAE